MARTTGLFFPYNTANLLTHPFCREVYLGMMSAMAANRRHLLTFCAGSLRLDELQRSDFWSVDVQTVDSLAALEVFDQEVLIRAAKLFAVVCMDMALHLPGVNSVRLDHETTMRMAVKYLLDPGHRRIGYLGRTEDLDAASRRRFATYLEAMRQLDLEVGQESILRIAAPREMPKLAGQLARRPAAKRPSAFIITDYFWLFCERYLAAGGRVPADLNLLTFGVVSCWSEYLYHVQRSVKRVPPRVDVSSPHPNQPESLSSIRPTTAHQPAFEMGRWGILEAIRRVTDPQATPRNARLHCKVIPGNATSSLR